jgi:DNA-binding MarR family transcriptional regulator
VTWQFDGDEPRAWRPKRLLSPPQARALAVIRRVTLEMGTPPTLVELANELGTTKSWAKQIVDRLVKLGHITRERGLTRAIRVAVGWIPSSNEKTKRMRGLDSERGGSLS